ncbi:MAG TPA: LuxR C-terminal-related transcriptional regulator [Solirubrobacterales bacterium]|nr:LuxR C-terminal-related transcriptional regulator [Solirubrobacterales bacterium]
MRSSGRSSRSIPTCWPPSLLRIRAYLPSHLSFREIGERIHVSPNTVKTQAQAVYRKLDASSRAEAVVRARDAGLLGKDPFPGT